MLNTKLYREGQSFSLLVVKYQTLLLSNTDILNIHQHVTVPYFLLFYFLILCFFVYIYITVLSVSIFNFVGQSGPPHKPSEEFSLSGAGESCSQLMGVGVGVGGWCSAWLLVLSSYLSLVHRDCYVYHIIIYYLNRMSILTLARNYVLNIQP